MPLPFEILDSQLTPLGELMLRRRRIASLDGIEVLEVKLGDEFLMSSLFHVVEEALAELGLAEAEGDALDVVVGGLGLGYTAASALREERVRELLVVDRMPAVIRWHREGLVPLGCGLVADARCRFVEGDFFALAADPAVGFDPAAPGRRFDTVLLDIDHSPRKLLHGDHGAFYARKGLERLTEHLHPGGVFALWSDDPPDEAFLEDLAAVFATARAEVVAFPNPLLGRDSRSTVYVAKKYRFAVIGQEWKLVRSTGFGNETIADPKPFELYRIAEDPGESRDLAGEHPEKVAELKAIYEAWLADVSSTREDNYAPPRIVLGHPAEPVSDLSIQDWRAPDGALGWGESGVWEVSFAHGGPYDVAVRWAEPIGAREVALRIGDRTFEGTLADGATELIFSGLEVSEGDARISVEVSGKIDRDSVLRFVTFRKL